MPGIGEQGVRGTAPCWTEADRADLSGGPPGAERGTRSAGRATLDKDTDMRLQEPPSTRLLFPSPTSVAPGVRAPAGVIGIPTGVPIGTGLRATPLWRISAWTREIGHTSVGLWSPFWGTFHQSGLSYLVLAWESSEDGLEWTPAPSHDSKKEEGKKQQRIYKTKV